jgi:crossover junction endodeoxyribonuclease RuvC
VTLPHAIPCRPGRARRVLGIDPGTACGWALVATDGSGLAQVEGSGTWDLAPSSGTKHPGARYQRLLDHVQDLVRTVDVVAYELVHRHQGTIAAHVWGGLVGVLLLAAADADRRVLPVHYAAVKQRATGKGNASKGQMQAAATALLGREVPPDEADALFVALAALDAS